MNRSSTNNDSDIRLALHSQRLRLQKAQPNTLVIDELGLVHSRSRIDVAVIGGHIHGYEIKSAQDNLDRFESQLETYRQTLHKLTIVADRKHLPKVSLEIPEWCGLIAVEHGPRGGLRLNLIRPAKSNPEVDPVMLAHLLWRPEIIELLIKIGFTPKELRRPRKQLYEMLRGTLTLREITSEIRYFMFRRSAWRDHPRPE